MELVNRIEGFDDRYEYWQSRFPLRKLKTTALLERAIQISEEIIHSPFDFQNDGAFEYMETLAILIAEAGPTPEEERELIRMRDRATAAAQAMNTQQSSGRFSDRTS